MFVLHYNCLVFEELPTSISDFTVANTRCTSSTLPSKTVF